jgi:hypothetical protein
MSQRTMKNAELLMNFVEIQKIKNLEMRMDNQD